MAVMWVGLYKSFISDTEDHLNHCTWAGDGSDVFLEDKNKVLVLVVR